MKGREPVSLGELLIGVILVALLGAIVFILGMVTDPEKTWPKLVETIMLSSTIILFGIVLLFAFIIGVWIFAGGGRLLMFLKSKLWKDD